jgi:protein TonB
MRVAIQTSGHTADPGDAESLRGPFAGSLVAHGALAGIVAISGLLHLTTNFGTPHASSGSVGVNVVKSIPLPEKEAPVNPLANDSQSPVPQAPAPVKFSRQVVEEPKTAAVEIPDKFKKNRKASPKPQSLATYRPPVAYQPNQVYSNTPQATKSALFGTQGSGGIDIGPASVLGSRFGAYVDLMRDRIAQHWVTADVRATPAQKCAVSFAIARNGTISNVQVSQPSGNYLLDTSAKRAILDSSPLPALPQAFTQNEATVELWFQVHQ